MFRSQYQNRLSKAFYAFYGPVFCLLTFQACSLLRIFWLAHFSGLASSLFLFLVCRDAMCNVHCLCRDLAHRSMCSPSLEATLRIKHFNERIPRAMPTTARPPFRIPSRIRRLPSVPTRSPRPKDARKLKQRTPSAAR